MLYILSIVSDSITVQNFFETHPNENDCQLDLPGEKIGVYEFNLDNTLGKVTDVFFFVIRNSHILKIGGGIIFIDIGILTLNDIEKHMTDPVYAVYAIKDKYMIHKLKANSRHVSFKTLKHVNFSVITLRPLLHTELFNIICTMPKRPINQINFSDTKGSIVRDRGNKQKKLLFKKEFLFFINSQRTHSGYTITCHKTREFIGICCGREGIYSISVGWI